MRTPTTQELAVQTSAHKRIPARVWIANAAGTYVDFTTLAGVNWLDSATYTFDSEQPVASAKVNLRRDYELISLAPLVAASILNHGSVAVDVKRKIKIETATVPEDMNYAIQSGDWRNVFEGYIDEIDPASDSKTSPLVLQCRDLGAKLQDRWLKKTGRPDGSAYGTLSGGRAMETVAQDLLDDVMGAGAITLYTPNGSDATPVNAGDLSGWMIKQWVPDKQSLLDALRILANQIGYEIRYRWSTLSTPAKWRLEIFNPPRSKVTPDGTILVSQYFNIRKASISVVGVRNDIDISYQTDPNDPTTRTTVNATDATSVARYDDCWMGVTEGASSAIDTPTEANKMAAAILHDLKDPKLNHEAEGEYLYQYELYDLVAYKANGIDYDSDQNIGVASISHELSAGKARTTIYGSGVVRGAYSNWHMLAGTAGVSPSVKTWPGPTLLAPSVAGTVGGAIVKPADSLFTDALDYYEVHLSTTTGFTPSPATLQAKTKSSRYEITGLTPGTTYFAKLVPIMRSGVVGPATAQSSVTPGLIGSALIGFALGDVPDGSGFNKVAGVTAATHGITGTSFDTTAPIDLSPLAATGLKSAGVPIHLGGKAAPVGGPAFVNSLVYDAATTNFVLNPSFEVSTSNWTVRDTAGVSTLARNTSTYCQGIASGLVTTPATAGTHGIRADDIAAAPGDVWAFSAYIQAGTGSPAVFCRIEFLDSGHAVLGTFDGISASVESTFTAFNRIGVEASAPVSTAFVRCSVVTTTVSATFWVDAAQAEKNSYSSYCDGSLGGGYSWSGTAHASTSSRASGFHVIREAPGFAWQCGDDGNPYFQGVGVRSTSGTSVATRQVVGLLNANENVALQAFLTQNDVGNPSGTASADISISPAGPKGRTLIGANGQLSLTGAGTSFPATPMTNDVYFRTDLGALYYYNGSAWITVSPANQAAFSAWLSTAGVTLAAGTPKLLVLNNTEYNLGAHFSTGTGLFTAPVKGIYHFSGSWLTTAAGVDTVAYVALLFKNGVEWKRGTAQSAGGVSTDIGSTVSADVQLSAGDTIGLYAISSGTPGVNPAQTFTWLMGHLVTVTP